MIKRKTVSTRTYTAMENYYSVENKGMLFKIISQLVSKKNGKITARKYVTVYLAKRGFNSE